MLLEEIVAIWIRVVDCQSTDTSQQYQALTVYRVSPSTERIIASRGGESRVILGR